MFEEEQLSMYNTVGEIGLLTGSLLCLSVTASL